MKVIDMKEWLDAKRDQKVRQHLTALNYPDDFNPFTPEVALEEEGKDGNQEHC
jgi:hypothetical protein